MKEECLSNLILFSEGPLSRTLAEFFARSHGERNQQGKGNHRVQPDLYLVIDSVKPDTKHQRHPNSPAPADGAGRSGLS